jgi:nucleoside-diphosphate-sugar epimerase
MSDRDIKVVLPGGAGLVGQNLVVQLKEAGYKNITVIDKHHDNLEILKAIHPDVLAIEADLAESGQWEHTIQKADVVVMLQAQIGAKEEEPFIRNNIISTKNIITAIKNADTKPYLLHISSSVIESVANDYYTNTKKEQENLVLQSDLPHAVLRPTLMFGWFDRKHLGWLSRFMKTVPIFPIPGHGRFMRQPLYVKDFCNIIISCIQRKPDREVYNISGHEKIDYIEIIREMKKAVGAKTIIVKIPYSLFYLLLKTWAIFDKDPPFTTQQLKALTAKDEFEVIDWHTIFNVSYTPFKEAIYETFNHPVYSKYKLKF